MTEQPAIPCDYVVRIHETAKTVMAVWRGRTFKGRRAGTVQYRISHAASPEEAAERALSIHRQRKELPV